MYFCHSDEIWQLYPELIPGLVFVEGVSSNAAVGERIAKFHAVAESRLAAQSEGELPEIQAWRRAFSRMGLKPTQYRCASEALLRRFRKEGALPQIHPLIDLCNAVSLASAIPVAVLDVTKLADHIEVRRADGSESYLSFSGETEHPDPGEVIFADAAGQAHARRWTNRQSRLSAISDGTTAALIVAEGMHETAPQDVRRLMLTLAEEVGAIWSASASGMVLTRSTPRFDF
jgi:DNA/RNA-binding domain of Phe-tRNA-synthetase-like protein